MNTVKITTSQNIELEYDLAGLGERIIARIIDGLFIVAYIFMIVITAVSISNLNKVLSLDHWWIWVLAALPIMFYDLLLEVLMNGQSVGKRLMHIKVVSLDGAQPTLGQYLIRWLFRFVDFTITSNLCALISAAASTRGQRVGDMVANTTLIKTRPRTHIDQTIYTPQPTPDYNVTFPEVTNLTDKDMQLVKEVMLSVNRSGNTVLAYQASEKLRQTLHIQTTMEPMHFLHVLLSDYNYLTSQEG